MSSQQRLAIILAAGIAASLSVSTFAADPPAIADLVPRSSFSPDDSARLDRYVRDWCRDLNSSDVTKVPLARTKLLEPLRSAPGGPSNYFRHQYGKLVVPQLPKNGQDTVPIAVANALQVAGFLATGKSVEYIAKHFAAKDQPNVGLRIMAANCFRVALTQGSLGQDEINRNLRALGRAGDVETDGLALRRQFEALGADKGPISLEVQIELLQRTAQRIAELGEPSKLMTEAVYLAVFAFRQRFVELDGPGRSAFARKSGLPLLAVLEVGDNQWDVAQPDDRAKADYAKVLNLAEATLALAARELNAQPAGLDVGGCTKAWNDGDPEVYRRRLEQWRQVLTRAPFAEQ